MGCVCERVSEREKKRKKEKEGRCAREGVLSLSELKDRGIVWRDEWRGVEWRIRGVLMTL